LARFIYEWKRTDHGRRLFRRPGTVVATTRRTTAAPASEPEPDLASLKKDELIELAEEKGLDSSGNKADIIERLTDGD
jgi:hypothetical protein